MAAMKTLLKPLAALLLAALLAGGGYALGRFFAPRTYTATPTQETVVYSTCAPDAADRALLRSERDALRAEKAALQERLDALLAEQAQAAAAPAPQAAPERRMSRRERLEQLKQEDPERYAEMEKRRKEARESIRQALDRRDSFLGAIDLSLLTPEQQEMHARFVDALAAQQAAIDALNARMEAGEDPTEEERRAMREAMHQVRGLQDAERGALLSAVAVSMGLEGGEETEAFVGVVKDIYDSTGMMPPMQMGPARGAPPSQPPPSVRP